MMLHQRQYRLGNDRSVAFMDGSALTNFAKHMVELRKRRGWSQPALAEKAGTAANVIGRYERGEVTPSIEMAKKIADAFESSLDYMTGDVMAEDPEREKAFTERCRVAAALPKEDQDHMLYLMDAIIRDTKARSAYA